MNITAKEASNPMAIMHNKLLMLKSEKEAVDSEIENLRQEKLVIMDTLPKVLHQLKLARDSIRDKQKEATIYDSAIAEIESKCRDILFTTDFFDSTGIVASSYE